MLDSAPWKCVDALPPIGFSLDGTSSVRAREAKRRTSITTAEGRVARVESGCLWLVDGDALALTFSLPAAVDLRGLLGQRIRVTLCNEPLSAGPMGQLLTVADHDGRVWMIAHHGPAQGNVHTLGPTHLCASLSQRANGPMVFGTAQLQCVVFAGEKVVINDAGSAFVMHFVARSAAGHAAYVIVDRALWCE